MADTNIPESAFDFLDSLPERENGFWSCDDIWDVIEAIAAQPSKVTRAQVRNYRGDAGVYALQAMMEGVSIRSNRLRYTRKPLVRQLRNEDGQSVLDLTDAGRVIAAAIKVSNEC